MNNCITSYIRLYTFWFL